MRKLLLVFLFLYISLYSHKLFAKEQLFKENWLEVKKKVRIYKSYNLRRRRGYLQPGNYTYVAIGANYYQLDDSTYIKKSKNIKEYKVLYKPEGYVSVLDTVDQHREHNVRRKNKNFTFDNSFYDYNYCCYGYCIYCCLIF